MGRRGKGRKRRRRIGETFRVRYVDLEEGIEYTVYATGYDATHNTCRDVANNPRLRLKSVGGHGRPDLYATGFGEEKG